ncbi:hypothetical protein GCM10009425_40850 [Pseudomonas asuensis]|uniref:DNA adenine modification methylase n=1 Tax=Pseudomonas asuensis TaxID=1825787 RepID=A0ABQ2H2X9_9PSED|nr:DNA adenine modification methylase [Pseudomonas asuensis]GGM25940.1 hypothetical protein GCM10009425_40850 [Pseudomonas asuensis]
MKFESSVVGYPDRGHWGDNEYRGNCTGHIIKSFFETYHRNKSGIAVDPSIGGGTSVQVAAELGLKFVGTDLHQGFNLLLDDLRAFTGEDAHSAFWHPPYADMIHYSGNVWGEENPWDMSRMRMPEFAEALELAVMNIHDCVEKGGHYGILMGNLRREGAYYNLSSLVERIAPGKLVDEIIKVQHNCQSNSRSYSGKIIRIAHEKLLIFRRGKDSLFFLATIEQRAAAMTGITWRAAVRRLLQGNKTLTLQQINVLIEPYARTKNNKHWQAKIRQVVQDERYFVRVASGTYQLAA